MYVLYESEVLQGWRIHGPRHWAIGHCLTGRVYVLTTSVQMAVSETKAALGFYHTVDSKRDSRDDAMELAAE